MEQVQYLSISIPTSPAALSPQKNLTGPPRIARDITADLYNNIQKWNSFHITGGQIVKQIANVKFNEPNTHNPILEDLTNKLSQLLIGIKTCVECFELLQTQIAALKKLLKTTRPLFISLSPHSIVEYIDKVTESYLKEFNMKQFVLENLPHTKNIDDAMFFGACWVHQIYITDEVNLKVEALLIETGHRKII